METALAIVAVWFLLILLVAPLAGRAMRLLGGRYPPAPYDWQDRGRE